MNTILYEVADGVGTITLNRPQVKNAIDPDMAEALSALLASIKRDHSVHAVVLTGAGGNFSAGGDVRAMGAKGPQTPEERREGIRPFQRIAVELHTLDRPVIAAVDGVAFGAGMSLLLLADMVLVSDRARLCMVFQRVGLIPDLAALYTLPRVVGVQRAKELILSAREVGAHEACALGLAMEVVHPDALQGRAAAVARSLAGASPVAVALVKSVLQTNPSMETLLELEASGQAIAGSSGYAQEAMRRFATKEAPQFQWQASHAEGKPHA